MNNDENGFNKAQREYDRQEPPEYFEEDYEKEQRRREYEEDVEDEFYDNRNSSNSKSEAIEWGGVDAPREDNE